MQSYVPAEQIIGDAWGHPTGGESIAERVDTLIREGAINGSDIVALVATAISSVVED
jgi:hypothetical protein